MSASAVISTGQSICYNTFGHEIPCLSTGQDAAINSGIKHPDRRFQVDKGMVWDSLTGLIWTQNANPNEFPVTWQEALDLTMEMNLNNTLDCNDWRLPNRRELHSLMHYQTKKPSLPPDHPFNNYFLGWYWTSSSAAINPAYAWNIHLEGARMFYSSKDDYRLFWPVRGKGKDVVTVTGQTVCFGQNGGETPCLGSGQDGALQLGRKWPEPRFEDREETVYDRLTNLCWLKEATLTTKPVDWHTALSLVTKMRSQKMYGRSNWRLPNILELESLTDCSQFDPALPTGHLFTEIQNAYWSSTTSFYETDWAWVYYVIKGALGVGYKPKEDFFVWAVS